MSVAARETVRVVLDDVTLERALCDACGVHVGVLMGGIFIGRCCRVCIENRNYAMDEPTATPRVRRRVAA